MSTVGFGAFRAPLENRGAEIAEVYYAGRCLDGAGIIRSAELLYQFWTQSKKVKLHAIADGVRRQAYIIAQARISET